MKKLRPREVKQLQQGLTARKWKSCDSNSGLLGPKVPGVSTELLRVELMQISIHCHLIDDVVDLAHSSEGPEMHTHHFVQWAQALSFPWEAEEHS